jgi:excisionase family DNA binding protein
MREVAHGPQKAATLSFSEPIWVRPAEAARLAGIGLTKLYELIGDGTLESRVIGRTRLIRRLSIERLGTR